MYLIIVARVVCSRGSAGKNAALPCVTSFLHCFPSSNDNIEHAWRDGPNLRLFTFLTIYNNTCFFIIYLFVYIYIYIYISCVEDNKKENLKSVNYYTFFYSNSYKVLFLFICLFFFGSTHMSLIWSQTQTTFLSEIKDQSQIFRSLS